MRNATTRVGIVAILSVALFSWVNRKTVKLNVRPFN